jgi:hypothetical protein
LSAVSSTTVSVPGSDTNSHLSASYGSFSYNKLDTGIDSQQQADGRVQSITTTLYTDWAGASSSTTSFSGSSFACIHDPLVTSIVPKSILSNAGDNGGIGDYGSAFFGSTLARGQPFVFAGDTILTAECESINPNFPLDLPSCIVKVHRIYGSEDNQYTLVETNARLPARGIAQTPQQAENMLFSSNVLRIPYSYTTNPWTHNPATASENAVFYAVNPYWQVFSAFIQYCNNPNSLGTLQLSVTSSFARITVHRVYPYIYCPPTQSEAGCYEGMTSGVMIPTSNRPVFDYNDCFNIMDIAVSSMDYINTENIAIQVVRARLADTNPQTLEPTNFSTATYFLNTVTMQIREDRAWNTLVPQAIVATQGQLCPALRRMPQLGSLATELAVAGVHFLRMPFNLILNGIYIFERWSDSSSVVATSSTSLCPLVTRGHSAVLQACGSNALSLKDFFASMTRVNNILFGILALISRAMTGFAYASNVRTFLNGIKMFGMYQTNPMVSAVTGGKLTGSVLGNSPLHASALNVLTTTLHVPAYLQAFKLGVANMAMADFVWHFVVELVYRIVRAEKGRQMSAEAVFWQTMYDMKEDMDQIITKSLMQSCAGLSLTFGYTNPWAQFARFQCNAMSTVFSNIVEFLNVFMVSFVLKKCFYSMPNMSNFHSSISIHSRISIQKTP